MHRLCRDPQKHLTGDARTRHEIAATADSSVGSDNSVDDATTPTHFVSIHAILPMTCARHPEVRMHSARFFILAALASLSFAPVFGAEEKLPPNLSREPNCVVGTYC